MSSPTTETQTNSAQRLALLIGGDLLSLLLFTWIGRSSHSLPGADISAGLETAAPFVISWFLVAPWFGLFRREISQNWRKLVPRLLLVWLIAGPLAGLLRALFLGRPIPEGIVPIFVVVTMTVASLLMLAWRLGYLWWANRTWPHAS
ncbi:MAG TPA: DUF3054 domain-containing protein [Anaerolineae bacterium]|nr:DUF3054 domain-containing protein [Anaerolineae bacterium]